jgi:uncharacterized protein (DUF58 family)
MNKLWYYLSLAIIIAAILFRQPLLLVIGLLLLLIAAITDIWATYCLRDLRYQRHFSEQRVLFGEQITLSLTIENAKLLPLPWVEVEEAVPRALTFPGQRLRVDLKSNMLLLEIAFSPRWYDRVTRRYTVQCNARGVHAFGPTRLRSGDIFGFLTREVSLQNWEYLLVYPLVAPLTRFGLPSRHPFGDYRAPRRLLEDPSRVIGVREYQYGDDLRRIHWKATARAMQLQSKVYEATTTYTIVLFVNVVSQMDQWYGIHPGLEELTICAAASVTDWAIDQGFAVGLYANTILFLPEAGLEASQERGKEQEQESEAKGRTETLVASELKRRRIHLPPANSEEQRKRIMDTLARVQSYFGIALEDLIQAERTRLPAGATVVVITSSISDQLLDTLAYVRQSGHAVSILFVGNTPPPVKLAGVSIYHIGGEETWEELQDAYSNTSDTATRVKSSAPGFQF